MYYRKNIVIMATNQWVAPTRSFLKQELLDEVVKNNPYYNISYIDSIIECELDKYGIDNVRTYQEWKEFAHDVLVRNVLRTMNQIDIHVLIQ